MVVTMMRRRFLEDMLAPNQAKAEAGLDENVYCVVRDTLEAQSERFDYPLTASDVGAFGAIEASFHYCTTFHAFKLVALRVGGWRFCLRAGRSLRGRRH